MDLKKCKTCSNRKGPGAYASCMNCINDSNYSPATEDKDIKGTWKDNVMKRFMRCE